MAKNNKLGAGTKNMTVNVPESLYNDISELAKASGMRIGEYMRAARRYARENEIQFATQIDVRTRVVSASQPLLAAEDPATYRPPGPLKSSRRKKA